MRLFNRARTTASVALLGAACVIALATTGCSKETAEQAMAPSPVTWTARFTNPIEIEPQPSEKCIACHTKTHPIEKLGSLPVAGAETGG